MEILYEKVKKKKKIITPSINRTMKEEKTEKKGQGHHYSKVLIIVTGMSNVLVTDWIQITCLIDSWKS